MDHYSILAIITVLLLVLTAYNSTKNDEYIIQTPVKQRLFYPPDDDRANNDPYFRQYVWADGQYGPQAPTGPAKGSTPYYGCRKKNDELIPSCYGYPKLGINSPERQYIAWRLN
jgi:hypothetical protein